MNCGHLGVWAFGLRGYETARFSRFRLIEPVEMIFDSYEQFRFSTSRMQALCLFPFLKLLKPRNPETIETICPPNSSFLTPNSSIPLQRCEKIFYCRLNLAFFFYREAKAILLILLLPPNFKRSSMTKIFLHNAFYACHNYWRNIKVT